VWLYKYRDLSGEQPDAIDRLESLLRDQLFWAARADTLNDPQEFVWSCSYEATADTAGLLARVLAAYRRIEPVNALHQALTAVSEGRLANVSEPVVRSVVSQLRSEVGLICFGRSPNNPTLWERYGGNGNGVAIGLEVDDSLHGSQLRDVKYVADKRVHVDEFLRASLDGYSASAMFEAALLTKPESWVLEDEVRFVSKRHSARVRLKPSQIKLLLLGRRLSSSTIECLEAVAARLPYALELRRVEA
jgi:hypothetical protein